MKSLKKVGNHVDLVIKNKDLYLEKEERTIDSLLQLLSQDAALLGVNEIIKINDFHGWALLVTPFDWVLGSDSKSRNWTNAFSRLTPFPEGGANAIRHEIFLMAFVQNIFVRSEGEINIIKGSGLDNEEMRSLNEEFAKDCFVIGFSDIETFS